MGTVNPKVVTMCAVLVPYFIALGQGGAPIGFCEAMKMRWSSRAKYSFTSLSCMIIGAGISGLYVVIGCI